MAVHPDTRVFLGALFARCSGGYLTFTALPPDELDCPTPSRHVALNDRDGLNDALQRLMIMNRRGWGACVSIAPRRARLGRYRRGGKRDLLELPALFVDLDRPEAECRAKLNTFPMPPSIRVSSGRGSHWYWLLDRPTPNLAQADRALRGLAEWFGGDDVLTTANAMRLPGTINPKRGRDNALCHLVELHPERRYSLAQFEPYTLCPPLPLSSSGPRLAHAAPHWTKTEYAEIIQAVEHCLVQRFDGFWKRNGWLSAICPFGHEHDRPGLHFGFNGHVGHCFGRHQTVSIQVLAAQLRLC